MDIEYRNPYVLLGIAFGSSHDAASVSFATRAKHLRHSPDGHSVLADLTWALNQISDAIRDPSTALNLYRVPADPSSLEPMGSGILNPPDELMARGPAPTADEHADLRLRAANEAVYFELLRASDLVHLPER